MCKEFYAEECRFCREKIPVDTYDKSGFYWHSLKTWPILPLEAWILNLPKHLVLCQASRLRRLDAKTI